MPRSANVANDRRRSAEPIRARRQARRTPISPIHPRRSSEQGVQGADGARSPSLARSQSDRSKPGMSTSSARHSSKGITRYPHSSSNASTKIACARREVGLRPRCSDLDACGRRARIARAVEVDLHVTEAPDEREPAREHDRSRRLVHVVDRVFEASRRSTPASRWSARDSIQSSSAEPIPSPRCSDGPRPMTSRRSAPSGRRSAPDHAIAGLRHRARPVVGGEIESGADHWSRTKSAS